MKTIPLKIIIAAVVIILGLGAFAVWDGNRTAIQKAYARAEIIRAKGERNHETLTGLSFALLAATPLLVGSMFTLVILFAVMIFAENSRQFRVMEHNRLRMEYQFYRQLARLSRKSNVSLKEGGTTI